ncbi:MerC domain-containing protein [Stenotrophomonas maltophilia]|uniref:MerC domain-containing protein n=1 Tax=Stenotrophomonas maltophilia TaxID=40324 RepID=UPI0021C6F96D|nr:MerC domain-containing protein [Stenotrophomonas maltophilia]MCU1135022.1 MerC domain-containing protein [Stenotrophomonas maltophilia]
MDHIPTTPARALAQPPRSARWHPRFDLAGAWLSLACAAHCIALPLLLAFVPAAMMALRSFQHPCHGAMTLLLMMSRWEWLFALLASSLALVSTSAGAHRHRYWRPLRLACVGAILLLSSSLYLPLKESLLWHGVATAVGGVLLACAHIANRRALHKR